MSFVNSNSFNNLLDSIDASFLAQIDEFCELRKSKSIEDLLNLATINKTDDIQQKAFDNANALACYSNINLSNMPELDRISCKRSRRGFNDVVEKNSLPKALPTSRNYKYELVDGKLTKVRVDLGLNIKKKPKSE